MATSSVFMLSLVGVPFAAAVVIALLGNKRPGEARWIAFAATVAGLVLASLLTVGFVEHRALEPVEPDKTNTFKPIFVPCSTPSSPHTTTWTLVTFGDVDRPIGTVQFFMGLDGLNVWLVLLTAVLMLPSVLVSWKAVNERVSEYY